MALLLFSNKLLLIRAFDSSPMLSALSRNPENLFLDIFIVDPLKSNPSPLKSILVLLSFPMRNELLETSPKQKSKSIWSAVLFLKVEFEISTLLSLIFIPSSELLPSINDSSISTFALCIESCPKYLIPSKEASDPPFISLCHYIISL